MIVTLRPVDDSAQVTLGYIESALGIFLASNASNELDAGQELMVNEAMKRLEQVAFELAN